MPSPANDIRQPLVPSPQGFGDGARFGYHQAFGGTSWSAHSQPNDEIPQNEHAPHVVIPQPANDESSLDSYDKLAFATEVSVRYHNRRKQHFDTAFRLMMLGVIVMGAAGFMFGLSEKLWMGLGIIGLAAGTLVWNVTARAREHDVLRSEYQTLLEQIRLTTEPTPQDVRNWRSLRLRIQMKEPAVYWAVANDCYYEVCRAWGLEPRERPMPPVMLRPFMNWFRF